MTPAEATEVAPCYGRIDIHRKAGDGEYFLQKYSPAVRELMVAD